MVKYLIGERKTKFTRELNTYGFDENGLGEELLFPIRLNDKSGGNKETNLATYVLKYKELKKTYVKMKVDQDKDGFLSFNYKKKSIKIVMTTFRLSASSGYFLY